MQRSTAAPQALRALIEGPGLADLGPGPRASALSRVAIDPVVDAALPHSRGRDLVRALVLLWNDHHEEAHALVQDLATREANLIHAILHRREPDFANASYWFHRVGAHPLYPRLGARIAALPPGQPESRVEVRIVRNGTWDPGAFASCCEEALDLPPGSPLPTRLRELQQHESLELLEHLWTATHHEA
ncbi:MAG TPA: hypothetical protein DCM86_07540 [Verrucomicrobiales bacterium]|nr:hypothetical protein [Verrucomicrobiales bacterium]